MCSLCVVKLKKLHCASLALQCPILSWKFLPIFHYSFRLMPENGPIQFLFDVDQDGLSKHCLLNGALIK